MKFLITCEHGGNEVPLRYRKHFNAAGDILASHRGYDPGALDIFRELEGLADESFYSTVSRLVIELNRSPTHKDLFSRFTSPLPNLEKEKIKKDHYDTYREPIIKKVGKWIGEGEKVMHFSIHTFTPVLDGRTRNADLGILYDPSRGEEKSLAKELKTLIKQHQEDLTVRFNYPYLGKADGFTTFLRKKFPSGYSGIELEMNQRLVNQNLMSGSLKENLYNSFKDLIRNFKIDHQKES